MCWSKWIYFFRSCRAHGQFLLCFACVCLFVCVFVCFHFSCILQCACYFFNCPCCAVLISISVAKRLVFCVFHVNTVGSGCGGNGDGDGGIYVELLFFLSVVVYCIQLHLLTKKRYLHTSEYFITAQAFLNHIRLFLCEYLFESLSWFCNVFNISSFHLGK